MLKLGSWWNASIAKKEVDDNATERVNIGHSYESGLCIEWQRKSVAWYNITIQYSYNLKFRSVHWFISGFSIVISRSTWLHNSIILYVFYRKPAMHTSEFLSHPNLFLSFCFSRWYTASAFNEHSHTHFLEYSSS